MWSRHSRSSLLSSFAVGFLWAGVGTLAAFGLHLYLAPPTDSNSSDHARSALAEFIPGISRWVQTAYAPDAGKPDPQNSESRVAPVASQRAPGLDDNALQEAQSRVARQQADVQAQRVLVRSIQQELQRVGCYAGAVDGNWSDGTRSAMGAFNDSLKVKLPLAAPDYILLTMLQGHGSAACGGPAVSSDKTTVAAARPIRRETAPRTASGSGWSATVTSTDQPPAVRPAPSVDSRVTTATRSAPPLMVPEQRVATSPAAPFSAAPLPGRMAIGAPATPPVPTAEPVAAPAVVVVPPRVAAPVVRQASAPTQRRVDNGGGGGGGNRGSQAPTRSSGGGGGGGGGDWRGTAFRGN